MNSLLIRLSTTANNNKAVCQSFVEIISIFSCMHSLFHCSDCSILQSASKELEHLLSFAWEKIHCGKWDQIDSLWRDLYALACYGKAEIFYLRQTPNDLKECVRSLDLGIMCGHQMHQQTLQKFVEFAHQRLVEMSKQTSNESKFPILRFLTGQPNEKKEENEEEKGQYLDCVVERPLTSKGHLVPIRDISEIDLVEFVTDYFVKEQPVLLKQFASSWPAIEKWKNLKYFVDAAGFRLVPVEIGKSYTANDWTTELMPFHRFLSEHVLSSESTTGYLAQHLLFSQIRCFDEDFEISDFLHVGKSEFERSESVNCWFGPKGTVTPLHHDPKHNILCQVVGYKFLRIYSPKQSEKLYAREGILSNTSQIDIDSDPETLSQKYPKFKEATYLDVVLEPGDALYLPPKWWHYVKSLSVSFSLSFWFE